MALKFNFFKNIEDKYKVRISLKKPIVIRLDGKNICKNPSINLTDEKELGFSFSLNNTAKAISRKFNAICTSSTDEINIIILNPNILHKHYNSVECQKISSFIAQEVSFSFNNIYSGDRILFDARTFNIPENKVQSYLAYRIGMAKNVYTIYYAKKLLTPSERINVKINDLESILNRISPEYKNRSQHNTYGAIFYNGTEISYSNLPKEQLGIDELINYLKNLEEDVVVYHETSESDFEPSLSDDSLFDEFLL